MSVRVMAAVWELELTPTAKLVLLDLANHAHHGGTRAYPGVERLAWKSGLSVRTVQTVLRELEAAQLIEAVSHRKGGRGWATEYTVRPENGAKLAPFGERAAVPERAQLTAGRVRTTAANGATVAPHPLVNVLDPSASAPAELVCSADGCSLAAPCWLHEWEAWPSTWRLKGRDGLWEAMALAVGQGKAVAPETESERGRWNRAVADLRRAGAAPAEVLARADAYRRRWPTMEFTPTALASNWRILATAKPSGVAATLARVAALRDELGLKP